MNGGTVNNFWFRLIAALVLLAAIVGIGYFAYNAGVAQGTAAQLPAASGSGAQPYPYPGYGGPFWFPHPFFGFGFGWFGLLIPLFLLFLVFGVFRRLIWGPRWGWHGMHHRHWMDPESGEGGQGVPPMVSEWHKRMHGESDPAKKD